MLVVIGSVAIVVVIGNVAIVELGVVVGLHVLTGVYTGHEDDLSMIGVIVFRLPVSNRAGHDTSGAGVVVLSLGRSATEKNPDFSNHWCLVELHIYILSTSIHFNTSKCCGLLPTIYVILSLKNPDCDNTKYENVKSS